MTADNGRLDEMEEQRRRLDREIELEKRRKLGTKLKAHFQRLAALDDVKVVDAVDRVFSTLVAMVGSPIDSADALASALDAAEKFSEAETQALEAEAQGPVTPS